VVVDAFELECEQARRDRRGWGFRVAGGGLDGSAVGAGDGHRREPFRSFGEDEAALGVEAAQAAFDAAVLVPVEEVEVEHLFAGGDQPHVERFPARGADGAEGKLEGFAADVVGRSQFAWDGGAVAAVEEREGVFGVRRHQHAVERAAAVGADPELFEELALLDEGGRLEVGDRTVSLVGERRLEEQVALLAVERVDEPGEGAVLAGCAEEVGEADVLACGERGQRRCEPGLLDPGEKRAVRRFGGGEAGDAEIGRCAVQRIAPIECMIRSLRPPGIQRPSRRRTAIPATSGRAATSD